MGIQETYVLGAPRAQDAVDLFAGEWASHLPVVDAVTGDAELFDDIRVQWAVDRFGSVEGAEVFECGPLEGGHTYGLLQQGAAHVTAVEAAPRAWLRCLVAKELLGMRDATFLLGGAEAHLAATDRRFDVGWCSGVLYHLDDPARLLVRLAAATDRLFVWTHVHDAEVIAANDDLATQFDGQVRTLDVAGTEVELHRHLYQHATESDAFCGGDRPDSWWLTREGLLALLERCGFGTVEIGLDHADHPNGPSLAIAATRTGPILDPVDAGYPPRPPAAPTEQVPALPSPSEVEHLRGELAATRAHLDAILATRTWRAHDRAANVVDQWRRRFRR